MASTRVSIQGVPAQRCCFVYPEGCAKIRQTCGVIVIAIATIAILAGVLLVLAQAGYPLEGINSLAHLIAPHHLYLGLALGGILLTLGVVYTVAEARHYAQRTFSSGELDKLNFPFYLSSLDIESSLDNQTFAKVNRNFDPQNQTPSIHAVVVKNDSGETTSYIAFRTPEGAGVYCATLEQQNYRDKSERIAQTRLKPANLNEETYTEEAACKLMDRRNFDAFHRPRTQNPLPPAYKIGDFELSHNPHLRIFALRVCGDDGSQCIYYKTHEARQVHVRMLSGYIILNDLENCLWGWNNAQGQRVPGLIAKEEIEDKCPGTGDFWRSEVQCNGETVYVAVYRGEEGFLLYICAKDAQNLDGRIENSRIFGNDMNVQYGNTFRQARLIDKMVTSPGQYWTEAVTYQHAYVYYCDTQDGTCKMHLCKPEAVQNFLTEHNLITDTKMVLKAGQYPKALATHLLKLYNPHWKEQTHVLNKTLYLSPGEYASWRGVNISHTFYSTVSILTYKDTYKVDHVLYFRDDHVAAAFIDSMLRTTDVTDGLLREQNQFHYFLRLAPCIYELSEDKKPLCLAWSNPDNSYISYFTYDGKYPPKLQHAKTNEFETPLEHYQLTPKNVLEYEVGPAEIEKLEQTMRPVLNDFDKITGLQPNQYVIRPYLHFYSVILLRAPEDNSQCIIEYYRKGSDRYSKRLTALKDAGYTDAESLEPAT
jgi:hypothetical protein